MENALPQAHASQSEVPSDGGMDGGAHASPHASPDPALPSELPSSSSQLPRGHERGHRTAEPQRTTSSTDALATCAPLANVLLWASWLCMWEMPSVICIPFVFALVGCGAPFSCAIQALSALPFRSQAATASGATGSLTEQPSGVSHSSAAPTASTATAAPATSGAAAGARGDGTAGAAAGHVGAGTDAAVMAAAADEAREKRRKRVAAQLKDLQQCYLALRQQQRTLELEPAPATPQVRRPLAALLQLGPAPCS